MIPRLQKDWLQPGKKSNTEASIGSKKIHQSNDALKSFDWCIKGIIVFKNVRLKNEGLNLLPARAVRKPDQCW